MPWTSFFATHPWKHTLLVCFGLGTILHACSDDEDCEENESSSPPVDLRQAEADYNQYCALCHGINGEGYVADGANALANPVFLSTASDELIRSAIIRGRMPETPMSAWGAIFGGPLDDARVDGLVQYIRTWQREDNIPVDSVAVKPGVAMRGQAVYEVYCQSCHGEQGRGGSYMSIQHPDFLAHASDGFLLHTIDHGRPGTVMPGFSESLPEQSRLDLVSLIRSWQVPVDADPDAAPMIDLGDPVIHPLGPPPNFPLDGKFIGVDALKLELDRGAKLVILDARPSSDWLMEHIAGARPLPFFDVSKYLDRLPRDTWIVTYCGCPHAASEAAADTLIANGFTQVKVLDEGFWVWLERGYPTQTGNN